MIKKYEDKHSLIISEMKGVTQDDKQKNVKNDNKEYLNRKKKVILLDRYMPESNRLQGRKLTSLGITQK
jgi:hypothetical protein